MKEYLRIDLASFLEYYEIDLKHYLNKSANNDEYSFLIELKEVYTIYLESYNLRTAFDLRTGKRNILTGGFVEYSTNRNVNESIEIKMIKSKIKVILYHIDKRIENYRTYQPINEIESNHLDVFKNKGFILFDYILNNYVSNNRGRKSDLNFYFRKLYKEGYIIESCRAENFKQWYEINFDDEFGQIKTLDEVRTEKRNRDYTTSLEWFKQHK